MRILAIDPGSEQSAWLVLDTLARRPAHDEVGPLWGKIPNAELLDIIRAIGSGTRSYGVVQVVGEMMSPRGMPVSRQEMATLVWLGRFIEAAHPVDVDLLEREHIKRHFGIVGGRRAPGVKVPSYDTMIRSLMIDRFGDVGGRDVAIGKKATPGPLYGIKEDVWQALAVAVAWSEDAR